MSTVINYFATSFFTLSIVILIVIIIRGTLLRRLPKKYAYLLWAVVGIRLLCPVSLPSPVSIFNLPVIGMAENTGISMPDSMKSGSADSGTLDNASVGYTDAHSYAPADTVGMHDANSSDLADSDTPENPSVGKNDAHGSTDADSISENNALASTDADSIGENDANSSDLADSNAPSNASVDYTDTHSSAPADTVGMHDANSSDLADTSGSPNSVGRFFAAPTTIRLLFFLWLTGLCCFLCKNLLATRHLNRELTTAVLLKENIYESDRIDTPFVKGIVRPRIYIPFRLSEVEKRYILAHETHHIRRFDPLIKLAATLLLGIYWFHPLIWLAYRLMVRDMEMSCDEYVLCHEKEDIRKAYSTLLLSFAVEKCYSQSALCFGEHNAKTRITHIMKFKKPRLISGICALLVILLTSGCTLTSGSSASGNVQKEQATAPTAEKEKTDTDGTYLDIKKYHVDISAPIYEKPTGLYVDDSTFIFTVNDGVFVWDKKDCKISQSLDLRSINCEASGEDSKTEFAVEKDGSLIWIHRPNEKNFYIYNTKDKTLLERNYTEDCFEESEKADKFIPNVSSINAPVCFFTNEKGEKVAAYLETPSWDGSALGQLCYCDRNPDRDPQYSRKPLFLKAPYNTAKELTINELHDIKKVSFFEEGTMELMEINNPTAIKSFESCLNTAKPYKDGLSGCPFNHPVYLTLADGTVGYIYPAFDGCPCFIANGIEYETTNVLGESLGFARNIFKVPMMEKIVISSCTSYNEPYVKGPAELSYYTATDDPDEYYEAFPEDAITKKVPYEENVDNNSNDTTYVMEENSENTSQQDSTTVLPDAPSSPINGYVGVGSLRNIKFSKPMSAYVFRSSSKYYENNSWKELYAYVTGRYRKDPLTNCLTGNGNLYYSGLSFTMYSRYNPNTSELECIRLVEERTP